MLPWGRQVILPSSHDPRRGAAAVAEICVRPAYALSGRRFAAIQVEAAVTVEFSGIERPVEEESKVGRGDFGTATNVPEAAVSVGERRSAF